MAEIIDGGRVDLNAYKRATEAETRVKPASAWIDSLIERRNAPDEERGARLPWAITHDDIRLRPGELSIWAGVNAHGKTLLTGQVMQSLMQHGHRCLLASFEMRPEDSINRAARQCAHTLKYTDEFLRQWGGWSDGRLWIFNHFGSIDPESVLAMCRLAVDKFDIQHIFIDSLMKVVRGEDDYNGQKFLVDGLHSIAQGLNPHIHLIHHMRKAADEFTPGNKFGLKGSGSISDQPDNVFIVWRNKSKENARKDNEPFDEQAPDNMLLCEKQRNHDGPGDSEPRIPLWFHADSTQYVSHPGRPPFDFMENFA